MVFSSAIFLFGFLPIVLLVYFLSPAKGKNYILLFSSLLFYTWGEQEIVLVMLASTLVDYSAGLIIRSGRKKVGLILSVSTNLLFLGFFKYFNFAFDNFHYLIQLLGFESQFLYNLPQVALPIGISFYTFQSMSYTFDVYFGKVKANKNFLEFATYVTLFPQLVAGPIVRYKDIHRQLRQKNISLDNFVFGIERFVMGLAKKMLIANSFATIADSVFSTPVNELSSVWAWIGVIAYSFQIYYDFSGYSDMAIGLGKMLGFDFLENFNYPYSAKNIREFWRRWHISLSTWFRDYLYIPLGGSRVSMPRVYLNLFIVFVITGLWHGASWNFVVWGLFHGLFIVIERFGFDKILEKAWIPFQHIYTLLVVLISWVLFRGADLTYSMSYIIKLFSFSGGNEAVSSYFKYFHINNELLIISIVAIIFSMPVYTAIEKKLKQIILHRPKLNVPLFFIKLSVLTVLLIISSAFISAGSYNPFIYFRF